jgi:hypothetical protein
VDSIAEHELSSLVHGERLSISASFSGAEEISALQGKLGICHAKRCGTDNSAALYGMKADWPDAPRRRRD